MPKRKSRNKTKRLGAGRTHGRGNKKCGRGGGTRGGRGMAGSGKHKYTYIVVYEGKDYFGRSGFVRHVSKKKIPVSNLYEIDSKATKGKLEKKEGKLYYEFKGKILGAGVISAPVAIKALSWSKKAEEKIKAAGGDISKIE